MPSRPFYMTPKDWAKDRGLTVVCKDWTGELDCGRLEGVSGGRWYLSVSRGPIWPERVMVQPHEVVEVVPWN